MPKSWQDRTVSVGEGLIPGSDGDRVSASNLSGFEHDVQGLGQRHLDKFDDPGYDSVAAYAESIGDPLTPMSKPPEAKGGQYDRPEQPGSQYGCHGEKQTAATISGWGGQVSTVGITRPMCDDCITFYGAVAEHQGTNVYTATGSSGRRGDAGRAQFNVFLPDGTHVQSYLP